MVSVKSIQRQWREIRRGGADVLRLKFRILRMRIKDVIVVLLVSPIFFSPLVIIRCLRPWFVIRFGELETSGVGHLALPVEIYLSEIESGLHHPGGKFIDIWFAQKVISNSVLLSKWNCRLTILPRWLMKPITLLNKWIPGGQPHRIPYRYTSDRSVPWQFCDIHNVLGSAEPHITFTAEEESQGFLAMEKMNVGREDPLICFIARDRAYHLDEDSLWAHRDSSIHTIARALNDLTVKGYKAIRMGAKVTQKNRFRALWPSRLDGHRVPLCRIGAEYLRKNRELLQ